MPPTATLLLVGDRDQLAAVAAGQVLGDLCRASAPERGVGPALAAFVQQTTGMALPVASAAPRLADHVIALRHSHRFGQRPGLGSFAQALAARQPAAAQAALFAGHPDLQHSGSPEAALAELADLLLTAARATTPAAALAALGSLRILTAVRHGPHGAEAWNHRVEALLRSRGCRIDGPWYAGRPVLVTANDHQSRLWNGDLGVTWRGDDGRYVVLFATTAGGHRAVPPLRLPAHTTAWAMTVHKAQGSEFDHVLLAMPDADGPWWQASLLYTAVTRARQRAIVVADPARLPAALAHWPTRLSGLATGWE
jgi:exodeoxyribonuclease V alpha subunit